MMVMIFDSSQWPQNSIILPGHEVLFSLETASDYLKDEKASAYGFKCLVVGYEWPPPGSNIQTCFAGLKQLEAEVSFLGGMCAASLIKKELQLPVIGLSRKLFEGYVKENVRLYWVISFMTGDDCDTDVEMAESVAAQTLAAHGSLLSKGLALAAPPTVMQAMDGMMPFG